MDPSDYFDLVPRIESCRYRIIHWKSHTAKKDLMIMLNSITRFHSKVMFDLIFSAKKGKLTPQTEEYLVQLTDLVTALEQHLLIAALTERN